MSDHKSAPEPFGYFKTEPFGWSDCTETDEGAQPLYDQAAIDELKKQRDELLAALEGLAAKADDLCGWDRQFDEVLDAADAAIASAKGGAT